MKKIISIILVLLTALSLFSGCAVKNDSGDDGKIGVVVTNFALYDFVRQTAGDLVDLTMLLPPGAESHSYEPTPADIMTIENCDLFIYVGGESDTWVNGVLAAFDHEINTVTLMDCIEPLQEETVEGMQVGEEEQQTEETVYDEHIWTSPKNAINIVEKIAAALSDADQGNAKAYSDNSESYIEDLTQLDAEFQDIVLAAKRRVLVFGDRFPILYFAKEYGLEYYAAFPGCASETEASSATIKYLIDKIKEENIPVVFYIELSNGLIADTLCETTGAKKQIFYTCHNVTKDDFENGATYLELMYKNADALREALN